MQVFETIDDVIVTQKVVLLRGDLNVPVSDEGKILDVSRIKVLRESVRTLASRGAKIILCSHFGRPEGKDMKYSLSFMAEILDQAFGVPVTFASDCIGEARDKAVKEANYGEVILLENLRFHDEEKTNDIEFAKKLAKDVNIYVNDAFSCCHRKHASIVAVSKLLRSVIGYSLQNELKNLSSISNKKDLFSIIGGSKISTKLGILQNLVKKSKYLFIGGGIANTILYKKGYNVGKSLYEKNLDTEVDHLYHIAHENDCNIVLLKDCVVCKNLKEAAKNRVVKLSEIENDDIIADIGPESVHEIIDIIEKSSDIVINGPLGIYQTAPFSDSTVSVLQQIALATVSDNITSFAGGGDTIACINQAQSYNDFSFISSGGGSFIEFISGIELPGIKALEESKKLYSY